MTHPRASNATSASSAKRKPPRNTPPLSDEQKALLNQLDAQVTIADRQKLAARIKGASKVPEEKRVPLLAELTQAVADAKALFAQRQARLAQLKIDFPPLPVSEKAAEIQALIEANQVVVVAGETGSGKTTQLPKMCLALGLGARGMIGHTQPRRLAARSVAQRVAEELNVSLGEAVGYKVRFNDQSSDTSLVKLMTDGILLAEIQRDRYLNQYEVIIIDEAHERSLNNDFLLGYLKQILPFRPDLKVIITSATIDVARFSRHFGNAPIIEVSGRTYPVEVRYRPLTEREEFDPIQGILNAVDELQAEGRGDILVFMSGEREIRDAAQALEKHALHLTEILPLYARLSAGEQQRIFQPTGQNRIILATNVAETSLTIPNIKYVIDTGLARISRYSYRTKVQRLPIEPISQASANQRKGRCGRVSEGICIRLYDEQDFLSRPEFTDPEILRTNLASVILQMTALGLNDISHFPFIDAPDTKHIQDGIKLLEELQAIETVKHKQHGQTRQLTALGKQLAHLPIDPRLARMVIAGSELGALQEVMIIATALSIQDVRERPQDKQQQSDEKHQRFADKQSDFLSFLNLWHYLQAEQKAQSQNQFRRLCRREFLNYLRIREWQDLYSQLRLSSRELGLNFSDEAAKPAQIHQALLTGLLSHLGQKENEKQRYLGARNSHFAIFPSSALFKKQPKWVMAAELVETTKLWARTVAQIEPEWIEPAAKHLTQSRYSEPHWSKSRAAVMASETVTLFGLPIVVNRLVNFGAIDPEQSRELFIRRALVEGDWQTKHSFFHQNARLVQEVEALEHKSRRRDILVDEQVLFEFYDARLPAQIVSGVHFDRWWKQASRETPELLLFEKQFLVKENATAVNELDFPNVWHQNGLKLRLSYQFDLKSKSDGVTVNIPLPLLNQVEETGFDWQIPGLRHELVVALIKSLPKALRRNFVPAPDYARAFLARVTPFEKPLLSALIDTLRRMSGVTLSEADFDLSQLDSHLHITFCIVDEKNRPLAQGESLDELKVMLKDRVQDSIAAVVEEGIEQQGLTEWSFARLPECYEAKKAHFQVKAYPALVDEGASVSIKLFETEQEQQTQMQAGLRRLLLLNVPSPIKYLHEKLPNKAKLGLYFAPFGKVVELIDDCIACAVDQLVADFGGAVWEKAQFNALHDHVRANLNEMTMKIAQQTEQILTLAYQINQQLKGKMDLTQAFAYSDMKAQMSQLIYPNFVTEWGMARLSHLHRYLQAIEKRQEKLKIDANQDRVKMLKVEAVNQRYQALLAKLPKAVAMPEAVREIRFMIEELRVNLFAQQLGTPYPISDKRILTRINELGAS